HRRGIVVGVKRQPTKRRQARHLRNPYSEYAAPPELGNSRLAAATTMPRLWRSQQLAPTLPAQNTPAHQRAEQPAPTPKPRQTRPSGGPIRTRIQPFFRSCTSRQIKYTTTATLTNSSTSLNTLNSFTASS